MYKITWEQDLNSTLTDDRWDLILGCIQISSMCARHSLLQYKVIHHILISKTRLKSFKRSFTVHLTVSGCAGMEDFPPEVAANLSWTSLVCTSAALEALKGQTQWKDLHSVNIRKGGCNVLTQPVSPNLKNPHLNNQKTATQVRLEVWMETLIKVKIIHFLIL